MSGTTGVGPVKNAQQYAAMISPKNNLSLSFATPSNNLGSAYLSGTQGAFQAGANDNPAYKVQGGSVLGASTGPGGANTGGGAGGTGGSGGSGVANTTGTAGVTAPDPTQELINQYYDAINASLQDSENLINQQQPGIISGINQNIDTSIGNVNRSNDAAVAQVGQSEQQGTQRKQDALTAATRLYNDLQMGGQQRFGGASSAGEAYAALTGRELQRNQAQIGSDYNSFMGQIATAKNNLQVQLQNALATLEQQRNSALSQAERDFQSRLAEINSQRDQNAANRASAQLSALQTLRNNIFNVNLAQAQSQQNLTTLASQVNSNYESAIKQFTLQQNNANTAGTTYNNQTTTNPTSQLSMATPSYNPSTPTYFGDTGTRRDNLYQGLFV